MVFGLVSYESRVEPTIDCGSLSRFLARPHVHGQLRGLLQPLLAHRKDRHHQPQQFQGRMT